MVTYYNCTFQKQYCFIKSQESTPCCKMACNSQYLKMADMPVYIDINKCCSILVI